MNIFVIVERLNKVTDAKELAQTICSVNAEF